MSTDNLVSSLSPAEMTATAEKTAHYKVSKNPLTTLFSAITAGVFISIGFISYIIIITSPSGEAASGVLKYVGGASFSLGLMLVVACGADLFTSTVLTILPKMTHRISWYQMFRNWLLVYIGNFIGAIFLVAVIWFSAQHMTMNGQWGVSILQTANHKLHHSFIEAVCLGFLANLMVCLAVWLSYAGRTLLDKMLVMILPIAMFVGNGFEHSIANMFMIPMGITIQNFATPDFWNIAEVQMAGIQPDTFSSLTIGHFLINNLIPVTIGNILGGLAVALSYWGLYLRKAH